METRGLTKDFAAVTAVDDVDWSVERSQTKAIIGPNGAGKSTFFNLLSGVLSPTAGQIFLEDEEITDLAAHEVAQKGLVKTYQTTNIFEESTVYENVLTAVQSRHSLTKMAVDGDLKTEMDETTTDVVDRLDLTGDADTEVSELSHGDQRKVEIGMALASDPSVILLDEPIAGMSREGSEEVLDLLDEIGDDPEYTVVITEHNIEFIMNVADTITVLHQGSILAEGPPDEIEDNEEVQEVYLSR